MKKGLFYLPIILFCTLFTGYAAKAQDVIPAKITGNWALPDCRAYEEALMITPHYYLRSDKEGSRFWPVGTVRKLKDYWVLKLEGQERPVRLEEDAVLKVGILPEETTPRKWPNAWDNIEMDGRHEYMGCADIPAILPDPLVRVMVHIEAIEASCGADLSKACTQLLFKIADNDKNKKISLSEMKMAAAMLTGFAALIENHTASRNVLDRAFYESFRETDRVADILMPNEKQLTYADFSGFPAKANSPSLNKALISIGKLFPGLAH